MKMGNGASVTTDEDDASASSPPQSPRLQSPPPVQPQPQQQQQQQPQQLQHQQSTSSSRRAIPGSVQRASNNRTLSFRNSTPTAVQAEWTGPLGHILMPREAAKLLGRTHVRRLLRSFRRVLALSQTQHFSGSRDDKLKSNGIFCYEETGQTSQSTMEYIFLQKETAAESLELNHLLGWFFDAEESTTSTTNTLCTTPNSTTPSSSTTTSTTSPTYAHVQSQRGSRRSIIPTMPTKPDPTQLWLEYLSFRVLAVPVHANIPPGVMECIFTSMSSHHQPSPNNSGVPPRSVVRVVDYVVWLAIWYHGTLAQQSRLAFRIYQSVHLVRGVGTSTSTLETRVIHRDTVSRFIFNIYGNEVLQSESTKLILDKMFLHKELTVDQFVDSLHEPPHVLLDWIHVLVKQLFPMPTCTPTRVTKLEEANARPSRALQLLCAQHGLSPLMVLECKRKFYSLLQLEDVVAASAAAAATTKPPDVEESTTNKTVEDLVDEEGEPLVEVPSIPSSASPHLKQKHLTESMFLQAVYQPSTPHLIYGGFLSRTLAIWMLRGGSRAPNGQGFFWTLHDIVAFSCAAVRSSCVDLDDEPERPLLEFVYRGFLQSAAEDDQDFHSDERNLNYFLKAWAHECRTSNKDELHDGLTEIDNNDSTELSLLKLGNMILALVDLYHYRTHVDLNPNVKPTTFDVGLTISLGTVQMKRSDAVLMALVTEDETSSTDDLISIQNIAQQVLSSVDAHSNTLSFDLFCAWQRRCKIGSKKRLGLLLQELVIVASVIFGIQPSTPKQERDIVRELFRRHKLGHAESYALPRGPEGTVWFLMNSNWMDQWNFYSSTSAHSDNAHADTASNATNSTRSHSSDLSAKPSQSPPIPPPPIDNQVLLRQGSLVLKPNLRHIRDFLLVPPLVWCALQAWHDGGPQIERKVVRQPPKDPTASNTADSLECEVELYPYCLNIALADATTGGQPRPFQQWQLVSRIEPTRRLLESLCTSLSNVPPDKARLWKLAMLQSQDREDRLLNLEASLGSQLDQRVEDGALLLLELYSEQDGAWPRDINAVSPSITKSARGLGRKNSARNSLAVDAPSTTVVAAEPQGNGIVGLYNMGNTCYLNSSMQCLSHTPLLREYFTSKAYLNDINTTNPLGQQGRLAQVTATLLCSLWKPGPAGTALTPKTFKDALGQFNYHFAGNEQHDAQELLAFLLSGLSEDLNRIVDQPYIEQPDSDGRPDKELADIWWKNHLRREWSIVVALFTGQYKSLLTCKTCHYNSARFEPFAFLQLPLPDDDLIPVTLVHFPIDVAKPVNKYSVRVKKEGVIEDSLIALAKILLQDELNKLRGNSSAANLVKAKIANDPTLKRQAKRRLLNIEDWDDELDDDDTFLRQVASNLAVVDMRECRINSITPFTRSLSQVRESDILYTFELDPVPTETKFVEESIVNRMDKDDDDNDETTSDSVSEEEEQKHETPIVNGEDKISIEQLTTPEVKPPPVLTPIKVKVRPDYVAIVQRLLEPLARPYLHEFTIRVFGTPLLLRVILSRLTASQVYDLVASRIHRLVPGHANMQFVNKAIPKTPVNPDVTLVKTTMEMERVAGGTYPRYGFRLRLTSRDGKRCSRCPWYECCIGCEVVDQDGPTRIQDGDTLAIDWHLSAEASKPILDGPMSPIKEQAIMLSKVDRHKSCQFEGKDITLEECLDNFSKEEEIPDVSFFDKAVSVLFALKLEYTC